MKLSTMASRSLMEKVWFRSNSPFLKVCGLTYRPSIYVKVPMASSYPRSTMRILAAILETPKKSANSSMTGSIISISAEPG